MPARVNGAAMAVVNGEKDDQGIVDKGKEDLQKNLLARDPKRSFWALHQPQLFQEAQKRP